MDEFLEAQAVKARPGTTGWWSKVLPDLSAEQLDSLMEAAESDRIDHSTIAIVLEKWGFEVSPQQVGHWRRRVLGR